MFVLFLQHRALVSPRMTCAQLGNYVRLVQDRVIAASVIFKRIVHIQCISAFVCANVTRCNKIVVFLSNTATLALLHYYTRTPFKGVRD